MSETEPTLWDPRASMAQHGEAHLRALAGALGVAGLDGPLRIYHEMTRHWGQTPLAARAFQSPLTFDGSPLEFSVATSRAGARLRWAVDCVAADGDRARGRTLGLELCERLRVFGADPSRLGVVAEVLAPATRPLPPMVGVDFDARGAPTFKAYLRGGAALEGGARLCLEALEALGLGEPAAFMREVFEIGRVGLYLFALDLRPADEAPRVKVYVDSGPAEFSPLMARLAAASGEGEGKLALVRDFVRSLGRLGPAGDPSDRAMHVVTTVQFVAGRAAPAGFACNYTPQTIDSYDPEVEAFDDARLSVRLGEAFALAGLDAAGYRRALAAFARVPLGDEYFIHNCTALQGRPGDATLSVYLNPRFNAYQREPDEW
jgi:hypothetical protein